MSKTEFRAIYEAHHAAVCAYFARRTGREDVEDLAAETFVVAWRKLPKHVEEPLPWLYAVARRVLANHTRKLQRRGHTAPLDPLQAGGTDPAQEVGDRTLAVAFAQLTEHQREAIRLIAWEGLSTTEAALAAGCTPNTFAVRLSRGRARLRELLDAATADQPTETTEELTCR